MPRSIWSGSISFGLVNIPVKAYSAIREHDVHFHLLAPDGSRVHNQRVSEKTGKVVEYKDLKKGYETSKGKYAVFEQEELRALAPESSKTIDIEDFVALEDIDPIFYERTYHVAPANDAAEHAYALLATVMEKRQRVGIGKVVMRDKQYLAAIRPYGKGLAMSTMLFADEVVPQDTIDAIPKRRPRITEREQALAVQILDSLASEWKPERYRDDHEQELRRRIKNRRATAAAEPAEEAPSAKVIDLMEALQASLDSERPRRRPASKRSSRTKAAKKAPTKRRSTTKRTTTKRTSRRAG